MQHTRYTIAVIDSGIGGVTVAAALAQQLRRQPHSVPVEIIFVDVRPRQGGYNDLQPDEQPKRFLSDLKVIEGKFSPSLIAIACNTLTAVYGQIPESLRPATPVVGIIPIACTAIAAWAVNNPGSPIRIFGTPITIQSNSYPIRLATTARIDNPIIPIPCPRLPGLMESGKLSNIPYPDFQKWISQSRDCSQHPHAEKPGLTVLACTHFALDLDAVREQLRAGGLGYDTVLNPNDAMVDTILNLIPESHGSSGNANFRLAALHSKKPGSLPAMRRYIRNFAPALFDELNND